ncbi:MAG: prepilin-type N-terminal cleavage/methylation domain-containing protein [Planctomycetota bacterium]
MHTQSLPQLQSPATQTSPRRVKYLTSLDQIAGISDEDRELLKKVSERYVFRANDYYLRLIDWTDPKDPIKQLIIPRKEELNDWGKLDASNEAAVTVEPGVQHKYKDTVLLLCNEVCGAYCRYCFRKRLFMNDNEEVSKDVTQGLAYIRQHPEVSNVLLTGGDPLIMGTRRLREIISALREIDHVKIIRIGSKMPAFNPFRILDDPDLQAMFREHSTPDKRIYLMCHFDHPRELTPEARAGIAKLLECGVICVNQCPIIRGINDDPQTLATLFREFSYIGCPQYYVFQGRPTAGNEPFEVPIVEGWRIFSQALVDESGLAGRARFSMSHASGKVEIQSVDERFIYLRYHRSKYPENNGRFFVCKRNDHAYWLDHLELAEGSYVPKGVEFAQKSPAAPRVAAPDPTPGRAVPQSPRIETSRASKAGGLVAAGFTLIELLVVISIIVLLIGMLAPALSSARKTAGMVRELAAIRQVGSAFTMYAQDNKSKLLPGYLRGSWAKPARRTFIVHESATSASEDGRLFGETIRPYPWRLMPYLDYARPALVLDRTLRTTIEDLSSDRTQAVNFQAAFSRHPTFGMNTTYVGGDAHRGGFYRPSYSRWGTFVVDKLESVIMPSKLMIFASSRGVRSNSGGQKVPGFHRLEGPWHATPTSNSVPAFIPWLAPGRFDAALPTTTFGHLDFRHFGKATTVTFDGHAETLDLDQLNDMRRWYNQATAANGHPR